MKLTDNLEEIFSIAFQADPINTEYHLTKIALGLPDKVEALGPAQTFGEYSPYNLPVYIENSDKIRLFNLISRLRSTWSR